MQYCLSLRQSRMTAEITSGSTASFSSFEKILNQKNLMVADKRIFEIARFSWQERQPPFSCATYLALLLMLPYMLAYAISYAVGIIFSYFISTYYVFRQRFSWKPFFQFPLVFAAQLFINLLILWLAVDRFAVRQELAPLIAVIFSIPVTYFMSHAIIKKRHDN